VTSRIQYNSSIKAMINDPSDIDDAGKVMPARKVCSTML